MVACGSWLISGHQLLKRGDMYDIGLAIKPNEREREILIFVEWYTRTRHKPPTTENIATYMCMSLESVRVIVRDMVADGKLYRPSAHRAVELEKSA